jgi:Beta-lactamase class C and other penicillin binding proteins
MKKILLVLGLFCMGWTQASAQALLNSQIPKDFDAFVQRVHSEWKIPGMVVAVVKDGQTVFVKGYGQTALDSTGRAVDGDTQFVIASTSKAFTAALLATVIDEGKLKWGDTLIHHLPEFQLYEPWVTQNFQVRDIMVHKTGFRAYAADDLPFFGYNRDELIRLYRHLRPTHSFRTTYAYNNSLYTLSAQLIEKYTGKSWDEALIERIFTPLEMKSSTTGNLSYFSSSALAKGYRVSKSGDTLRVTPRSDREDAFTWLSAIAPAGFVMSTGNDMAHWLQMLLDKGKYKGKEVISERNFRYLTSPQTITGSDSVSLFNYAQGWTIEQGPKGRYIRHTGLAYGYTALVGLVPELNMGFAILTNNGTTSDPQAAVGRQLIDMYLGETDKDWQKHYFDAFMKPSAPRQPAAKTDSIPPLAANVYTGEYFLSEFGTARVSLKDGQLQFALKKVDSPLKHKNGNVFSFYVPGAGNIDLTFTVEGRRAMEFTFDIGDPVTPFRRIE